MGVIKKKNFFLNSKAKNLKQLKNYIKKNISTEEQNETKINIEDCGETDLLFFKDTNTVNKNLYRLNRCCLNVSLFSFFLNKLYFIFLFNFFSNFYIIPNYNYYFFLGFEIVLFWVYLYLIKNLSFAYSYYMLIYNSVTIIIITLFFFKTMNEKYINLY